MGRKSRQKRFRNQRRKVRPDEVLSYGPLKIARYGRFIRFTNESTPAQHAEFLKRAAEAHKDIVTKLENDVPELQKLIARYDPIELLHRAAYMILPLFMKYRSENEFSSDESYFLPAVEYIQYLVARTPVPVEGKKPEEQEWEEVWAKTLDVLHLTQQYLFTRKTSSDPPSEIDDLRFNIDGRRLLIRVRRYPNYFADYLRDSLTPYERWIRETYEVDVPTIIKGLEQIEEYLKSGVLDRYRVLRDSSEELMKKLQERGLLPGGEWTPDVFERIDTALTDPELGALHKEVGEKARLTLTPAIFDLTEVTSLPASIMSLLSVRPGESPLTSLTGPDNDDLSPLSTSPLHYKPFVEVNGRFYSFYHSGFEDHIAEIIEADLFARFPDEIEGMRDKRAEYFERVGMDLLASVANPNEAFRNLHYPNPDEPGHLTELDGLMRVDDVLFVIEIKAGAMSAAASRGAPKSLLDELSELIVEGQRQSERAERYIKSAEEVSFFDESGRNERARIRQGAFRRIFRIVITREELGWVGARIAVLSVLDPKLSTASPWHVSVDDLRIVAELFRDNELRFLHFLEQRLKASIDPALSQHDEIEHIGLYNKINAYHERQIEGMDQFSFDASYMRDIDHYFMDKRAGESPPLPRQPIPARVDALIASLKHTGLPGRAEAVSIILDMDEQSRSDFDFALQKLHAGLKEGRHRSVRIPFTSVGYGITATYAQGENFERELRISAAQMDQGPNMRWIVIQLLEEPPYVDQVEKLAPGRFSAEELAPARAYLEKQVAQIAATKAVGRNDPCPCGSGKKYKKCHGL